MIDAPVRMHRYNPSDRTHQMIDPEAFALIQKHGFPIPPGRLDDKPRFRGMPQTWWESLLQNDHAAFNRLVQICMNDFPTYSALLLRIVSRQTAETQPFIWNNGQQILWNRMALRRARGEPSFFVVLKARQLGITTFVAAWHHYNLWKGKDVRALNVAHDVKLAERIVSFYRIFHDGLPDVGGIKPRLRAESKTARIPKSELYYADNRSHGETHVAKNLDPRGNSSRFIGESEAAFYPDLYGFNDALFPQLPSIGSKARANCSVIIESTPNGQNDFYEVWEECKNPKSEFEGVFLPWYVQDDEYVLEAPGEWRMTDLEDAIQKRLAVIRGKIDGKGITREQMYWRHNTLANQCHGSEDSFDMEYPSDDISCFLLRSESVFGSSMRWISASCDDAAVRAKDIWDAKLDSNGKEIHTNGPAYGTLVFNPLNNPFESTFFKKFHRPKFKIVSDGELIVWEPPEVGHIYFCGADSAGGEYNRDNSTIEVIDITTGRHVAEYATSRVRPEAFADFIVHLCLWYNKMMVLPEINGFGSVVVKRIMNDWGYMNVAHEEKWDEVGVKKDKPGWWTSERNRPIVFSAFKWMIDEKYLMVASKELMREMSTFKQDGDNYSTAKKGQHDDRVFAMGLCCIGIRQAPRFLMSMHDARRSRVPSAVDLGLNSNPSPLIKVRGATDEIVELLTRHNSAIPTNPMRPYGW